MHDQRMTRNPGVARSNCTAVYLNLVDMWHVSPGRLEALERGLTVIGHTNRPSEASLVCILQGTPLLSHDSAQPDVRVDDDQVKID